MKNTLLSIAGALLLVNPTALFAQCTAGQFDATYGATGTNGYVQISPVMFFGGAPTEDVLIDSSNATYMIAGAAVDGAGNSIAAVMKVKASGVRDVDFGGFGSVVPPSPAPGANFTGMTMDPQGRFVVYLLSNDHQNLSVTRYSPTGSLDLTYGTSGTATVTLPSGENPPMGIATAPDGGVLVALGIRNSSFPPGFQSQPTVMRLTPAGALDTTFGTNGYSMFYPSIGRATDVKALPDGTIIVGGRVGDQQTYDNYLVARLLANGSPDPSFGTEGVTVVAFGGALAVGRKLAIQSNGKIILAGEIEESADSTSSDIGLIRLKTNGTLDTTFGSGGTVRASLNNGGGIGVALQNNDKILIDFDQYTDAQDINAVGAIARFTASGQLDTVFGSGGVTQIVAPPPGFAQGGGIQGISSVGGKILAHVSGIDPDTGLGAEFAIRFDAGTGAGCH